LDADESAASTWVAAPAARGGAASGRKSASAIISRNPFDSVTGPLDRRDEPEVDGEGLEDPSGPADLSDPLNVPPCEGVVVHIVTESTDPTWSLAVVQAPGEQKGKLMRV